MTNYQLKETNHAIDAIASLLLGYCEAEISGDELTNGVKENIQNFIKRIS